MWLCSYSGIIMASRKTVNDMISLISFGTISSTSSVLSSSTSKALAGDDVLHPLLDPDIHISGGGLNRFDG